MRYYCPYCKSSEILNLGNSDNLCLACKRYFKKFLILDFYENLHWSLVKIAKGEKKPVEESWQVIEHRNREEWEKWLKEGFNIGVNVSLSNLTVIDFDDEATYEELKRYFNPTLVQKSNKGYHLFYKKVDILPTTNLRPNYNLDIKNNGQVVIEPSVIDGYKRRFLGLVEPAEMSEETISFLLKLIRSPKDSIKEKVKKEIEKIKTEDGRLILPEGNRHYGLISAGGYFSNLGFTPKQIFHILNYLNTHYTVAPKPIKEIEHICESLYGYKISEEEEIKREILDYLEKAKEANKSEIEIAVFGRKVGGEKKKKIDKLLVELIQERLIYKEKSKYKVASEVEWSDDLNIDLEEKVNFEVPYFYDVANFVKSDQILISAQTGCGKTHIALNIVKRLVEQGIKPFLIETEPTKRFLKIARKLGLPPSSFYYNKKVINPIEIEFVDDSVNIIDWLDPATALDFAQTSRIFAHLAEQARRHRAFMIIFMQLRQNTKQFAKDLVNQYPSLAVNYLLEEDRIHGKFVVLKNNDPKTPFVWEIPTVFIPETKEVLRLDELERRKKERN